MRIFNEPLSEDESSKDRSIDLTLSFFQKNLATRFQDYGIFPKVIWLLLASYLPEFATFEYFPKLLQQVNKIKIDKNRGKPFELTTSIYVQAELPLRLAVEFDQLNLVKDLIKISGLNQGAKSIFREEGSEFNKGELLWYAAKANSWRVAKFLLESGADVNYVARSLTFPAPLVSAMRGKHLPMVRLLLDAKASVYLKNYYGASQSAVSMVKYGGKEYESFKALIYNRAKTQRLEQVVASVIDPNKSSVYGNIAPLVIEYCGMFSERKNSKSFLECVKRKCSIQ